MELQDVLSIECIAVDIIHIPQGTALLVTGEFNADLAEPKGDTRNEAILAMVTMSELKDTT